MKSSIKTSSLTVSNAIDFPIVKGNQTPTPMVVSSTKIISAACIGDQLGMQSAYGDTLTFWITVLIGPLSPIAAEKSAFTNVRVV